MSEQNETYDFNSLLEVIQYLSDGGIVGWDDSIFKMIDGEITPLFSETQNPMKFTRSLVPTDYKKYKKIEPLPVPLKWYEKEGVFPCLCFVSDSIDFDKLNNDELMHILKTTFVDVGTVEIYNQKTSMYPFILSLESNRYTYAKPIKIEFLQTE